MISTLVPTISATGAHLPAFTFACLVPVAVARGYYLASLLLLLAVKFLFDGTSAFSSSSKSTDGEEPWTMVLYFLRLNGHVTDRVQYTDFELFKNTCCRKQLMG